MEFGALICTARNPDCAACPLQDVCAWYRLGRPASATKPKTQKWAGTDRQLRGAIMDVLKTAHTADDRRQGVRVRSEEHTSELQSRGHLVCRLLREKKEQ